MKFLKIKYVFLIFIFFGCNAAAGVVLNKTNLVFNSDDKNQSLIIQNVANTPTLIQSWVTKDNVNSNDFLIAPPLFRLEGRAENSLRVVKMSQELLSDRETLYFINVKSVPPTDPNMENVLSFAINTRITLRYRPSTLNEIDSSNAYKKLEYKIVRKKLKVFNPTPYYISLKYLSVDGVNLFGASNIIAPFSSLEYSVKVKSGLVSWNATQIDSVPQEVLVK